MSSINPLPPANLPTTDTSQTQAIQKVDQPSPQTTQQVNFLLGVLEALLGATQMIQGITSVHSKSIQSNASQQETINNEIGQLQYDVIPSGTTPSSTQVDQVNATNQNIQFQRSNLQQTATILRQSAQAEMQQVTSLTDAMQQATSGTSATLKLMGTVLKLINQISQPK